MDAQIPPNGSILHLVVLYDAYNKRIVNPNYDDYDVVRIRDQKKIGKIRRMFGGTSKEYWMILSPKGSTRMYEGKSGSRSVCNKLMQLHGLNPEKITLW